MKWIGNGVLRVGKKDYFYGDDIPTEGISPERIAQLKSRGKIGEVPVAGPDPEITRLNARIIELETKLQEEQKDKQRMEAAYKKLYKEKKAEFAALEDELKKLQSPPAPSTPEGGAGPTPDKKGK